jgi:hypothetical protein
VDSMKVSLRAATHLDFTQFAPTPPSSRYGALVASYYTLAWFDRYLRGGTGGALARLTAPVFDASADVHNISGGQFDAASGTNVPARIAGQPVADRLSFHFRSAWSFRGGSVRCEDIRAGCAQVKGGPPRCGRPRFRPRVARVRHGRVRIRPRVRCRGRARHVVVRIRAGKRSVHVVAGKRVRLRVGRRVRRLRASFAVDGRRHRAAVRLRR